MRLLGFFFLCLFLGVSCQDEPDGPEEECTDDGLYCCYKSTTYYRCIDNRPPPAFPPEQSFDLKPVNNIYTGHEWYYEPEGLEISQSSISANISLSTTTGYFIRIKGYGVINRDTSNLNNDTILVDLTERGNLTSNIGKIYENDIGTVYYRAAFSLHPEGQIYQHDGYAYETGIREWNALVLLDFRIDSSLITFATKSYNYVFER
jgi:hypothetical protein